MDKCRIKGMKKSGKIYRKWIKREEIRMGKEKIYKRKLRNRKCFSVE